MGLFSGLGHHGGQKKTKKTLTTRSGKNMIYRTILTASSNTDAARNSYHQRSGYKKQAYFENKVGAIE